MSAPATCHEIVKRIESGVSVVPFAKYRSDGNRVLPFRSALLGAVEELRVVEPDIVIQPVPLCMLQNTACR